MRRRRDARVIAFCAVYESIVTKKKEPEILVDDVVKVSGSTVASHIKDYALQLVRAVNENKTTIEKKIERHLSNRTLNEILPIEKALLLIGVAEMMNFPDVPYLTVINEMIELAKEYGGASSSRFINGVLNAIYEELKGEDSNPV